MTQVIRHGLYAVAPIGMDCDVDGAPGYRFYWEETQREWKGKGGRVEVTRYDVLTVRGPGGWTYGIRIGQHKPEAERRQAVVQVLSRVHQHTLSRERDNEVAARGKLRETARENLRYRKAQERAQTE